MKFTVSIEINKPIDEVVNKFDNPENMLKWMEGLTSFEHISGVPGEIGAKSKLVFEIGKRKMELIETITNKNLPYEFFGTYEAKGIFNIIEVRFKKIDETTTLYESTQNFKLSGFMKIMGFIMPNAFKKQSLKYLEDFKIFAENS
jgi:uncharacterized membrane protein